MLVLPLNPLVQQVMPPVRQFPTKTRNVGFRISFHLWHSLQNGLVAQWFHSFRGKPGSGLGPRFESLSWHFFFRFGLIHWLTHSTRVGQNNWCSK